MRLDIRQILDILYECGFTLHEQVKPQSPDNWNVDSVYEFENEFKKITLSFINDPTPGYLSSVNPSKRKQKLVNALDEVRILTIDKSSGETGEKVVDLRNSSLEEIGRLKRFITFT
ncbi:hypothetical protein [uncultured Fluviicola sp.]|uniref:hypothetical protein n=1 Tax=uncultured Fluviicola sp. TaxID=463303 RepID=UPI0025DAF5A5|nr:hypothetical protein [uncultured Fluviicola sp.]